MTYQRTSLRTWMAVAFLAVPSIACDPLYKPTSPTSLWITQVSPNAGAYNSAIPVTITGGGFKAGTTVAIGGEATAVVVTSSSRLTLLTPLHEAGVVDVVVTLPNGERVMREQAFSFNDLTVSGLSTPAGFPSNEIAVRGTGFRAGLQVFVDGQSTGPVTPNTTGTEFSFLLPEHGPGDASLVISNSDGRSMPAPPVRYYAASLSSSAGAVAAGDAVNVSWVVPAGQTGFIGLYRDSSGQSVWFQDQTTPAETMTLTAPLQAGSYHFRYYAWHDWDFQPVKIGPALVVTPPSGR